jgi:hypothetical protein
MVFDDIEKKILTAQETMDLVKNTTLKLLNGLEHTESKHITLRDLSDKVISETGVGTSIVNGLVPMISRQWESDGIGTVSLGRNGGAHWGIKEKRVDPRKRCDSCKQVLRNIKNINQ